MPLLIQILLLQHFFVNLNCIIILVQTQISQLICAFVLYVSIKPMLGCRSFPLVHSFFRLYASPEAHALGGAYMIVMFIFAL
jgi:hypothetical protein